MITFLGEVKVSNTHLGFMFAFHPFIAPPSPLPWVWANVNLLKLHYFSDKSYLAMALHPYGAWPNFLTIAQFFSFSASSSRQKIIASRYGVQYHKYRGAVQ